MSEYRNSYQLFLHLINEDTSLLKRNLDELVDKTDPLHSETLKLIDAHIKLQNDTFITPILNRNAMQLLGDEKIEQMEGEQLGVYKLVKKIGKGGMSVVYLAERNDGELEQEVAIKVIKPSVLNLAGSNLLNREAQILENLKHPNIGAIHDIGRNSEGLPYIVMEYINGMPIDDFCNENELNISERLKIFKTLCEALQTVHSNAIIHADIKPSNILIDKKGTLKLMDFGISRNLQLDEQEVEIAAASKKYASPEQLLGRPLDTASDIYSLGKVAEDLFLKNQLEHCQLIKELEWLIERATTEQKSKRTITIESLILAIDALIHKRKVSNYPYTTQEQLAFFVKDNPLKVTVSLLAFVFLIIISTVLYSKNKAIELEKNIAEETAGFLESIFQFTDPASGITYDASLEELLDRSQREIEITGFSDDKSVQRIRIALANAYLGLGKTEKAKEQVELMGTGLSSKLRRIIGGLQYNMGNYETAINAYEELLLENDLELSEKLEISLSLIKGYSGLNQLEDAESHLEDLKGLVNSNKPENGKEYILKAAGFIAQSKKDFSSVIEIYEELLTIIDESAQSEKASILFGLGYAYEEFGNLEKAFAVSFQAAEIDKKLYGENHPVVAWDYGLMGYLQDTMGLLEKSISSYQNAIDIFYQVYPKGHPELANTLNNQAYTYKQLGEYEQAYQLQQTALKMSKKFLDENHPRIANIQNSIGVTLSQLGRFDESAQYYRMAYQSRIKSLGADHVDIHTSLINLAHVEKSRKDFVLAHTHIDHAIEILTKNLGVENYKLISPLSVKAGIFREQEEFEKAIKLDIRVVEMAKKMLGENHWRNSFYLNQLSLSYFKAMKYGLAIEAVERAIQNLIKQKEYDEVLLGDLYVNKGKYLFKQNNISESIDWIQRGLALYQSNKSNKVKATMDLMDKISQENTFIQKQRLGNGRAD